MTGVDVSMHITSRIIGGSHIYIHMNIFHAQSGIRIISLQNTQLSAVMIWHAKNATDGNNSNITQRTTKQGSVPMVTNVQKVKYAHIIITLQKKENFLKR